MNRTALNYQMKSIRRDKLCILTFLLPILVGLALNLLSDLNFSAAAESAFGILKNDLSAETVSWLRQYGSVTEYNTLEQLEAAVIEPSTQVIGILSDASGSMSGASEIQAGDSGILSGGSSIPSDSSGIPSSGSGIRAFRSGDETTRIAASADLLPALYADRGLMSQYKIEMFPSPADGEMMKHLLIVITMVTAMFMGCTFNAMSIISEKEDGILYINEILPMTKAQYALQKIMVGFLGGTISTVLTALICIRLRAAQLLPLLLLIVLSAFIAALTGLFIAKFSESLMVGIVYIKLVMILFLAPPILFYLLFPAGGVLHTLSYLLPSSATFYGLMKLLNGSGGLGKEVAVLAVHCVVWFLLYVCMSLRRCGSRAARP
ncbi:MAG: ABC transporter permease [Schaedlerella sp.]|uniref:ABC transporter permease n=1 Tax=Schaedlerella sp. TaxID=2676057 RepID=UPI003528606C